MSHWLPEPAATEQQRKNYRRGRLRAFVGVLADTSPRMSFSDYGSKRSGTNKAAVAPQLASTGTGTGLSKISDVLSQYQTQKNVGILEKLAHSVQNRPPTSEIEQQCNAQIDVLQQLENKSKSLLSNPGSGTPEQMIAKLRRDFDRVQQRVQVLKGNIDRAKQQHKSSTSTWQQSSSSQSQNDYQGQLLSVQAQLEQDRLNEAIMREREEEIRNINRGMHQVNEIYKDLAHIVDSQQEQIDTVGALLEDAKGNAESGLKQVEKANERQGNGQCTLM